MSPLFWSHTVGWPVDSQRLYLWCFTCPHVSGITGIGEASDELMKHEARLTRPRLRKAKLFLSERESVMFVPEWFWVRGRAKYLLECADGRPDTNKVIAAAKFLSLNRIPEEIVEGFCVRYGYLFDAVERWPTWMRRGE